MLHDTRNADPNNGLHSRFESEMLSVTANLNGITALSLGFYGVPGLSDPRNNEFDVVIVGNGLVAELIAADLAHVNDPAGFYLAVKELTARRFGDALTLLASMLWSAWAEAGSPELPGFGSTCSRLAPASEIVLRGYPPVGGFIHDAGWDVGQYAGTDAGAGGVDAGDEADAGVAGPPPPSGCGCATEAVPLGGLLGALLLALSRRRVTSAS